VVRKKYTPLSINSVFALLGVTLLLLMGFQARAQVFSPEAGNIKIGDLQIHPSMQVRTDYSTNVYQSYGGLPASSGFITALTPALKFLLPVAQHQFFAEYKADFNLYSVDSETNYIQQRVGGGAKLKFGGNLDLSMTYYYTGSEIPRLAKSQFGNNLNGFNLDSRPYNQNDFKGLIGWSFADRWRVEGLYNFFNTRYKNEIDFNSNYESPSYGGKVYYRFTSKVSSFGEYTYSVITYPYDPVYDNRTQFAYLGLAFDPSAKLRGELKVGYETKKYERSIQGRADNPSGTAIDVNLTRLFSDYTALKLLLNRRIAEDLTTNAPYTENKVGLELKHFWSRNEKVSGTLRGGYSTLRFEGQTEDIDGSLKYREDQRWEFGAGLGYDFRRWLTISLGYQYINNASNFINYDFRESRLFLNILAAF
jgi:polysaccharide biosynthesis protein VpsM